MVPFNGLKKVGAMPSPSCAKQPRLGAITGSFLQYTTLAWWSADFLCVRLVFLMSCGNAALALASFFTTSCRRGVRASLAMPAHIPASVLRQLYARSNLAVFTVPINKITWLPSRHDKAVFIPVGSNFPELGRKISSNDALPSNGSTVAVFGIHGGTQGVEEVGDITYALKCVQSKGVRLRLIAIGRGSAVFEGELPKALDGSGIEFSMLGLMPAENLVQALAIAQVLLCVRGHVSSRRGSAIAGIVCGVPIVGYRGAETGFPITEAGVKLVDPPIAKDWCKRLPRF